MVGRVGVGLRTEAPVVELARAVYKTNDRRSVLTRKINEILGSRLIDEKSYTPY